MTNNEIMETVQAIREYKRMKEELEAEIAAAEDLIKAEMNRTSVYVMTGTDYKVTWNEVTSSRIDTTAIKRELPDIASRYTKTTTSRRFVLA
jgi:predicted phage-related endonuclease